MTSPALSAHCSPSDWDSENVLALIDRLTQKSAGHASFNQTVLEQLRQGYVPSSPSELAKIDAFLSDADLYISESNEAIIQMQNRLDTLTLRRNDLQRARDNVKALTSPIRRLPVDVLLEIFLARVQSPRYSLEVWNDSNRNGSSAPQAVLRHGVNCPAMTSSQGRL